MDLICNIACMSFLSFQIHQPEERCPILDINHDSCSGTRVPPFFTSCMRRGFLLMRASFVVIDHASDARARKGLSFYLSACRFPVFLCQFLTQHKCIGACAGGCPSYVWGSNKKCLLRCLSELRLCLDPKDLHRAIK